MSPVLIGAASRVLSKHVTAVLRGLGWGLKCESGGCLSLMLWRGFEIAGVDLGAQVKMTMDPDRQLCVLCPLALFGATPRFLSQPLSVTRVDHARWLSARLFNEHWRFLSLKL